MPSSEEAKNLWHEIERLRDKSHEIANSLQPLKTHSELSERRITELEADVKDIQQRATEILVKAAESNVKLALIVGGVCTLGSGVVMFVIQLALKKA